MTDPDLTQLIEQYRAGLEAELVILRQLERPAARQREASDAGDLEAFNAAADDRDRLMTALVTVEGGLRDLRQTLSKARDRARRLPGYGDALTLHREAIRLIADILKSDELSAEALASAELARRELARAIEQGETTLSAYLRVMATPPGATLVNRRG
jgi:hypothetical protein